MRSRPKARLGAAWAPSLLKEEEKEILEDLLIAAHTEARAKVEQAIQEKTQELMGGLGLPAGMKLPF